jgi:hypothetical protein
VAANGAESLTLDLGKIFTFFFLTLGPNAVIAPFARDTATLAVAERREVALTTTAISLLAVRSCDRHTRVVDAAGQCADHSHSGHAGRYHAA